MWRTSQSLSLSTPSTQRSKPQTTIFTSSELTMNTINTSTHLTVGPLQLSQMFNINVNLMNILFSKWSQTVLKGYWDGTTGHKVSTMDWFYYD